MKDCQGLELKIGQNVWELLSDEVAKVIEILTEENKVRVQYFGEENYLEGEILECSCEEVEII